MDDETPRPAPPRRQGANVWLVGLLIVLVGALLYKMWDDQHGPLFDPDAVPRAITPRGDLADDETSTIDLFQAASPSVVHITNLKEERDRFSLDLHQIPQGTGTGFVWDSDGHIVTNYHVVQTPGVLVVDLGNQTYKARVVGYEMDKDLAVLKIDAPPKVLRPLPVGTSTDLKVGQKVFAIGNPFGLDQTLTTGVISGLGREIQSVTKRPIQGVIQTDAAINPGNSGGPLLDSAGRLIGVNTAIYSPSGAYAGIGFAVPVDTVNRIVPQLIRGGTADRPGLGVTIFQDDQVALLRARGILDRPGVLILDVIDGGGAAAAGLRGTRRREGGRIVIGDLISGIDGQPIENSLDLFRILDQHQVGDTIQLNYYREGEELQTELTLHALPTTK